MNDPGVVKGSAMGRLLEVTTLHGRWGCFDPDRAEILLPPDTRDPRTLYRLAGRSPRETWVLSWVAEDAHREHVVITEIEAARLFVERGHEPPEEIGYLLVVDDITRPWLAPGAKRWKSDPDSGWRENLYRTPNGLFVLEYLDRPHGQGRWVGVPAIEAVNWLAFHYHDEDSDAVAAELAWSQEVPAANKPPQEDHSLARGLRVVDTQSEPGAADPCAKAPRSTPHLRISSGWTPPPPARLPTAWDRAYQSYRMTTEEDPSLETDKEVYHYIRKNGCNLYEDGDLPEFETWARYVRRARRVRGEQKHHPRAGRDHSNCIVEARLAG